MTHDMIGPYRILRPLGEGGMGEVYLAERADHQFRQRVAIKLVRRGVLSAQLQGRLKVERQILATLDHPNIARLLDGGDTSAGTPYLVMEFIDGEPIDKYCDKRSLPIAERLQLFKTVCQAVHSAHQNLIVHRDLKPSNILVTPEGVPKLLDFGIAKILDNRQMAHTVALTQMDVRLMTPDHASPEQIRGDPITTASDIYVLGVLLFELLTGGKPFSGDTDHLSELARAICEDAPQTPSNMLAQMMRDDTSGERAAQARSATAAKLRRQLRGDLDNIVLMAMRKEPERRYSSASLFATDIDRYMEGLPVLARPDSWSYRTNKFLRRHALVSALSATSLALLIGFSITTYLQSKRIALERDVATAQRVRAETERARAEQVTSFLVDLFDVSDPSEARGNQVKARDILDRGAKRLTRELQSQPELQATLFDTIGRVYSNLGLMDDAEPLLNNALKLRRSLFGENNVAVISSLYNLTDVYLRRGDLSKAESLAMQALKVSRATTGNDSSETASSLGHLGYVKLRMDDVDTAEKILKESLAISSTRLGADSPQVAPLLDALAGIRAYRDDLASAQAMYERALKIARDAYGEDHPHYVDYLHNLATVMHRKGDLQRAEELYKESIALYGRILGSEHPDTIAALSNLGWLYATKREFEAAERTYQEALVLNRKVRGPKHWAVGNTLARLADLAYMEKQFDRSITLFNEAIEIYRQSLPANHGYTAYALSTLGQVLFEAGRTKEAESVLQQGSDMWRSILGEKSLDYAYTRAWLARTWIAQGKMDAGEPALRASYATIAALYGPTNKTAREIQTWIDALE